MVCPELLTPAGKPEHPQRLSFKLANSFPVHAHSHASLLIELGFSALLVSERLGHENISTTLDIFSHLFPPKQSDVADKLDRLYSSENY